MLKRRTNPEFLNGVPELLILELLAHSPMHGYELVRQIHRRSGEALNFGEGCVYPILHRLVDQQLLTSTQQKIGSRTRVVYRVTPSGQARLADARRSWERTVAAVQRVLSQKVPSS